MPIECPAPPVSEFTASFDEGSLEQAWPGTVEVSSPEAITLVSTTSRRGGRAVEFRIDKGAVVNNGTRAELAWDPGDREGHQAHFLFSERLESSSWPDFDRLEDSQGRPTWQIVAQFHDQPDCLLGESWDSFKGNSPPLMVQYFWLSRQDPKVVEAFSSGRAAQVVGLTDAVLERPLLGLLVGLELRAVVPIEKGRWVDQRLDVTWGLGANGVVRWSVNDQVIVRYEGRNMNNAAPHSFKAGLYRNPELAGPQVGQLDEVFVTHDERRADAFAQQLAASR